jgi:outer membrane murein-binding lipoprotein Lpp
MLRLAMDEINHQALIDHLEEDKHRYHQELKDELKAAKSDRAKADQVISRL